MLIVGSLAMQHHFSGEGVIPRDTDLIGTLDEFRTWSRGFAKGDIILCKPLSADKIHVRTKDGWNYEFEIATEHSTNERLLDRYCTGIGMTIAPLEVLLMLKLSHRYRRNSPHFLKTMRDIQKLRAAGVVLDEWLQEVLVQREKETYTYAHPKLDVSKQAFFDGDGVPYVYDHDSIHLTVALDSYVQYGLPCPDGKVGCMVAHGKRVMVPAYTKYMKDGAAVMTSKEKFFAAPETVRLAGVYEETCVLALERSQIPFPEAKPRKSFEYALMKVCTSITSGWFREYAWENYDRVFAIYEQQGEDDYVQRFKQNQHLLKPYQA